MDIVLSININFADCVYKKYFIIDQQMALFLSTTVNVFQTPSPFYSTHITNPFLIQESQPITIKCRDFSQSWNPYTPQCSSSVESFLCIPHSWSIWHEIIMNSTLKKDDIETGQWSELCHYATIWKYFIFSCINENYL